MRKERPTPHRVGRLVGLLPLLLLLGSCTDSATTPAVDLPDGPDGDAIEYDHLRTPGASAGDLLSDDSFDRLIVQVQYVAGFPPDAGGLQRLEAFLNERVNKPEGVEVRVDEPLQIEAQSTYSAADVRALEQEHRTEFSEGSTLAVYILYLDGEYSGGANVLGIAYNNTSTALFVETIRQHSGGVLQPSHAVVEETVVSHELGHLLGLVNNGSDMQSEHQDEENDRHCDNENCLMFWAVRTTDFISNLLDGVPELDQDCIDDLRANGGR